MLCMSILEQVLCDFLSLYHVEVSVVMFVCVSVCLSVFYLCSLVIIDAHALTVQHLKCLLRRKIERC